MLTETFMIDRRRRGLLLSAAPVSAIASIVENGEPLTMFDFDLDGRNGALWRVQNGSWSYWPCGKIIVDYDGTITRDRKAAS